MASDSLIDDTGARQSDEEVAFSLTFTQSQWFLFWRLLTVGCILSDQLLDASCWLSSVTYVHTATLWNQLSEQFANLLQTGDVRYQKVTKTTR